MSRIEIDGQSPVHFSGMVWHAEIMLTALTIFQLKVVEMKSGGRNKRVIFGHTAEDDNRDAYDSFRYYVFLAKGNYIGAVAEDPAWWRKMFFRNSLTPRAHELVCSGSLLTPSIVQTACHCLSKWMPQESGNYTYVFPLNVWEDRIYSYVGSNSVHGMYDMLVPEHYVIYQSCRRMNTYHYNIMDYGLILSKEKINEKAGTAALSYAPVYTVEAIKQFYYETHAKEYMCLLIGHGLWDIQVNEEGEAYVTNEASELQRWGWRTLMNMVDCTSALYPPNQRTNYYFPNYTRETTWVCLQAFQELHEYLYNMGKGDSGGPVTCNNVYFAVNSFSFGLIAQHIIAGAGAIAFTAFENSADYRDNLIIYCNWFNNDPNSPVRHPGPNDLDPTPPPDIFPAAHSPPRTTWRNPIMILSALFLTLCT